VRTSNVVGTVRGTAFSTEVKENGDTIFVGAEHTVELRLINPNTGELDDRPIPLSENEMITITNENAREQNGDLPVPQPQSDAVRNDVWFTTNNESNETTLKETPQPSDTSPVLDTAPSDTTEITDAVNPPVPVSTPQLAPQSKPTNAPATPRANPISITITPSRTLDGMTEGETASLTATLVLSNGAQEDVTGTVTWSVVGNVGSISRNVFSALLDQNVSEFGRSSGSITAVWTDTSTREQILGKTDIFLIKAKVTTLTPEG
jgi:hypothetical protein